MRSDQFPTYDDWAFASTDSHIYPGIWTARLEQTV